jgi:cytoskeletal protein CcmA (bactofilin family)
MDIRLGNGAEPAGKASPRRLDEPKDRVKEPGQETAQATTTVVGPSIVIRGKLKCNEDLVIKGRVDAEIASTRAVHVENSGIVKANISAKAVTINGVLVGNVTAESRTEIAADGRVVGDLLTPKLVIADGATIRGRIDMPNFDGLRETRTSEPVVSGSVTVNDPPVMAAEAPPLIAPPPLIATAPPAPLLGTSPVTEPTVPLEPMSAVPMVDPLAWQDSPTLERDPDPTPEPPPDSGGGGLRRMLFDKGKKRRP